MKEEKLTRWGDWYYPMLPDVRIVEETDITMKDTKLFDKDGNRIFKHSPIGFRKE